MVDQLTDEQKKEYRQVFAFFDRNGDGVISMDEMANMLQVLGKNPTNEDLVEVMRELKGHETTTINFEDFLKFIVRHEQEEQNQDMLREVFRVFDRNADGFISPDELRNVMMQLGARLSDEELDKMMEEADLDGDGLINFEEFVIIMTTDLDPKRNKEPNAESH